MAVHNRPRHERSSTLVSTHPLQFQLSNRTSDSPHPLTLCTKKACTYTHTNKRAYALRETHTEARAGYVNPPTHTFLKTADNQKERHVSKCTTHTHTHTQTHNCTHDCEFHPCQLKKKGVMNSTHTADVCVCVHVCL